MQGHAPKEIGSLSFGLMDPEEYRDMSAVMTFVADMSRYSSGSISPKLSDPISLGA